MTHALAYLAITWLLLSVVLGLFIGRCIRVGSRPVAADAQPVPQAEVALAAALQSSPEWATVDDRERELQPVG